MSPRAAIRAQALWVAAGLATALWATGAPTPAPQGALEPIVDCALTEVELRAPDRDVELRRGDDGVWLEVTRRTPDGEVRRRFRGSERAEAYLDELEPLVPRRTLGVLRGEALAGVGLDEDARAPTRWVLRCGETAHTFEVGGAAYGSGDRYIRDAEGGPVHLVAAGALRALETAELQLREHRLHRFDPREVVHVRVRAPWNLELEQRGRRSSSPAWVEARAPSERRRDLDRLMRAVFQLSSGGEEGAPPPEAEVLLSLEMRGVDGDILGHLEVRAHGEGPSRRYWARSESSGGWVAVLPSAGAALARAVERVRRPDEGDARSAGDAVEHRTAPD